MAIECSWTGAHPDTVIRNARDLHVDLSDVQEVILTHYHWDHIGGLLTLRRALMKDNPKALSIVHVSDGIFDSRPSETGERKSMIAIRKEYEATGGRFIVHSSGGELFPGVWLTGPVPRVYSERNWSGPGKVLTASGNGDILEYDPMSGKPRQIDWESPSLNVRGEK